MTLTRTRRTVAAATTALFLAGGVGACSDSSEGGDAAGGDAEAFGSESIEFMVPSGAGGGWDSTARAMQKVMEDEEIVSGGINVSNVEGGGGATGLGQLQNESGDGHQWMMTGLVMIGSLKQAGGELSLTENATPIATLTSEAEAFVVPKDSDYQSIQDVIDDYEKDPKNVTWGGGSAGGSDQLVIAELLKTAELDAGAHTYVPYDGGGELLTGLSNGDVEVGSSGLSEFLPQIESGDLRLLAISTDEEIDIGGETAPTLIDEGYDMNFANWRGMVAAPGTSDEDIASITALLDEMRETDAWEKQLEQNNWTDFYKTGDEAADYYDSEVERVDALYKDLDL
ncbi:Bug family tripartite tricarboxylate transporter substrate binding protein [Janibacter sp. GS2]|uniref:Bug family tripartite tricarboxylate transporter substrate binding protein n=1 Tax=Janibacter sp. GS2 TaxID=3442646 RepID=UPI003EBE68E2